MMILNKFLNEILKNRFSVELEVIDYINESKLLITIDNDILLYVNKDLTCSVIYDTGIQQNNIILEQAIHNIRLELEI